MPSQHQAVCKAMRRTGSLLVVTVSEESCAFSVYVTSGQICSSCDLFQISASPLSYFVYVCRRERVRSVLCGQKSESKRVSRAKAKARERCQYVCCLRVQVF